MSQLYPNNLLSPRQPTTDAPCRRVHHTRSAWLTETRRVASRFKISICLTLSSPLSSSLIFNIPL
ncbi:hypothetical protein MTR_2g016660 [Medicago truncatula]|uniref:Uncharacterized protein n=1 Tax=Medicago truncatula TaxID=3880 RepID=A0A072V3N1_MEDTR|nr:hypothetical protein MTR_2g016660 [Medicago truncatula]